jgi:hypothetical protein
MKWKGIVLVLVVITASLAWLGFREYYLIPKAVSARKKVRLHELVLAYHDYASFYADGRGPSKAEDLGVHLEFVPLGTSYTESETYKALKAGELVLIWDVNIGEVGETPAGTKGTILGYEKDAPTKGGLVLMVNGDIVDMTAEEFQAAPKATPKAKR